MADLTIPLTPIAKSSNLAACGYHAETLTMDVQFTNGKTYRYTGVGPATFQAFDEAESKGRFFATDIRGQFPGSALPEPEKQEGART